MSIQWITNHHRPFGWRDGEEGDPGATDGQAGAVQPSDSRVQRFKGCGIERYSTKQTANLEDEPGDREAPLEAVILVEALPAEVWVTATAMK